MAILMVCSCGQEMVTEDEHAGRKVRCPNCKSVVVVPGVRRAPAGPVVARRDVGPRAEDDGDIPSRREGGLSERDGLSRARIGLGLHWGKCLCFLILSALMLLGSLVLLILTFVEATRSQGGPPTNSLAAMGCMGGLLGCLGMIVLFVMPLLGAIGSLMCFWLPERSGARLLSMVACGLDSGAFFFLVVCGIVYLSTVGSIVRGGAGLMDIAHMGVFMTLLFLLSLVLLLAGWILHMLVMKNLSAYSRYHGTADDVVRMLIIGLVVLVVPAILIWLFQLLLVGGSTGRAGLFIVEFLLIAWSGGLLGVSFKLLNLTGTVRRML